MAKEQKPNTLFRLCQESLSAFAALDTSFGSPDSPNPPFAMEDALREAGMTQYAPPVINQVSSAAMDAAMAFSQNDAGAMVRLPKLKDAMDVYYKIGGTLRKRAEAMDASSTKTMLEQGAEIAT